MVHAYQKGELKNPSGKIKSVASRIKADDATDFAKTKHKGLPMKKEEKSASITKLANMVTNYCLLVKSGHIKDAVGLGGGIPAPTPAIGGGMGASMPATPAKPSVSNKAPASGGVLGKTPARPSTPSPSKG